MKTSTAVPEVPTEKLTKAQRYEEAVEAMEKMVLDAMPGMIAVQIKKANEGNNNSFQFLHTWFFGRPAKNFAPPVHYNRPSYAQMREEQDAMFEQLLNEDRYPDDAVPVISSPHFGYFSRKFGTAPATEKPAAAHDNRPHDQSDRSDPTDSDADSAQADIKAHVDRIGKEIRELDPAERRGFLDRVRRDAFNKARDAHNRLPDRPRPGPGPLMREAVWQRREFKKFLEEEKRAENSSEAPATESSRASPA